MSKIGNVFPPIFDESNNLYTIEVDADTLLTYGAFPGRGSAWRQVVYDAIRKQARERYKHIIALAVMELLLENILHSNNVKITDAMNRKFSKYNKAKALALNPGTDGEGRNAAKLAFRLLANVIEESI